MSVAILTWTPPQMRLTRSQCRLMRGRNHSHG